MSRGFSTPCAREIGHEMRRRRQEAKMTSVDLGRALGWGPSKISRIESGVYPVSDTEVSQYLAWLHVPHEEIDYVLDVKEIDERDLGFWMRAPDIGPMPKSLRSLVYHEATAEVSTSYETEVVPGLLQTEAYVTELLRGTGRVSEQHLPAYVRGRMDRHSILERPDPGYFTFYIHENALRLPVGDAVTMQDQLLHLLFSSVRKNVSIRVVPLSAGARAVCQGSFRLLEYGKAHRPLVFLDAYTGGLFIDDPEYVREYQRLHPKLDAIALTEGESGEFLAALASDYDDRVKGVVDEDVEEEQL
jgi:transcriptional regulator with XRE-family HTH domain